MEKAARGVKIGAPIDEGAAAETAEKIERGLRDAGYAYAKVDYKVQPDLIAHHAHVDYKVALGPACTFGLISLEGTRELPLPWIKGDLIAIKQGEPYSRARVDEAIAALDRLGVFASVEVPDPSPEEPRQTVIPIAFSVTPDLPKTLDWGGGASAGSQVEGHVRGGFEHHDLRGELGRLTVDARLGLVLYPLALSTTAVAGQVKPLPQARLRADLVQPIELSSQTNVLVGGALNMYELLPGDLLGYFEATGKAGAERSFLGSLVHVALLGKFQFDQPFLYPSVNLLTASQGYGPVRVPLVELNGAFDHRLGEDGKPLGHERHRLFGEESDALSPHEGVYLTADAQVAGLDSEDVRLRYEVRDYIPLAPHWTLATRVKGGLLLPFGGPLQSGGVDPESCTTATDPCTRFLQILQLRGFQSGGPDSNRGYIYGGVGPHQPIPLPSSPSSLPAFNQIQGGELTSTGGSALWEASIELRFPVVGDLAGAVFLDGSDVWRLDLANHMFAPHLSTGFSVRYFTPIGLPLRADVGLRIPGAQEFGVGCQVYDPTEAYGGRDHTCRQGYTPSGNGYYLDPQYGQAGTIGGLPLAIALSFGESF